MLECSSYYVKELSCILSETAGGSSWGPSIFIFLGVFLVITMWAVLVTEGRRKLRTVYYNFELAPTKMYVLCFVPLSVDMSSTCEVGGCFSGYSFSGFFFLL